MQEAIVYLFVGLASVAAAMLYAYIRIHIEGWKG